MSKPTPSNENRHSYVLVGAGLCLIAVSVFSAITTEAGDANIGAGILMLGGLAGLIIGLARLGFSQSSGRLLRVGAVIAAVLVIGGSIGAWLTAENESNRVYCEEKIAQNETIPEGEEFCDDYR